RHHLVAKAEPGVPGARLRRGQLDAGGAAAPVGSRLGPRAEPLLLRRSVEPRAPGSGRPGVVPGPVAAGAAASGPGVRAEAAAAGCLPGELLPVDLRRRRRPGVPARTRIPCSGISSPSRKLKLP